MTTDLKELQAFALDFLQKRLQNPETPPQEKVDIALGLLQLQSASSVSDVTSTMIRAELADESTQNLPIPELYRLGESWQMWLVENKLRGVGDQSLVEILIGQGLTKEAANQVVFALPQEVSFAFLEPRWRSHQQQQLIAEAHREKEQFAAGSIDIWPKLSGKEFRQYYFQAHRPVILDNLGGDRPWHTVESFVEKFGGHSISAALFPKVSSWSSLHTYLQEVQCSGCSFWLQGWE